MRDIYNKVIIPIAPGNRICRLVLFVQLNNNCSYARKKCSLITKKRSCVSKIGKKEEKRIKMFINKFFSKIHQNFKISLIYVFPIAR
jgi:hypothetical protein